jgi:hypothetical protein
MMHACPERENSREQRSKTYAIVYNAVARGFREKSFAISVPLDSLILYARLLRSAFAHSLSGFSDAYDLHRRLQKPARSKMVEGRFLQARAGAHVDRGHGMASKRQRHCAC